MQCLAVLLGLTVLAFAPPASGRMLIMPVVPGAAGRLAAIAVDGDARLLAKGPLAGSLVVVGDRSRLAGAIVGAGGLLLAAPAILCGGNGANEDEA